MPCTRLSAMPWVAAVSAFWRSPAPRYSAIMALMPMPKPMAMALAKFWMGNTSERAVMASSLMRATNRLSTMLYRLFTSMEMTLGSAMDTSSGSTGFSFIKVSFIVFVLLLKIDWVCKRLGRDVCTQKSHTMAPGRTIVWRKVAYCCKNPHDFYWLKDTTSPAACQDICA